MPVMISRSGRCPWRTRRRRPASVLRSACRCRKSPTSASTACVSRARAPLRKISVSESVKVPGCASLKTLVSTMAYHSFGGEVEALNTPTIRRLTPSCRHQLSRIAQDGVGLDGIAFGSDGNLYVTTYIPAALFKIAVKDGKAGAVTALKTSRPLDHADAMRTFGDSLLLIEGNGKLDKVTIKGEEALIEIIRTASPNGPRKTLYNRYVRWAAKGVW